MRISDWSSDVCSSDLLANTRTDEYGGSFKNRTRFALEVCAAIREQWPTDRPLFFRISAEDEGGWSLDDSVRLSQLLIKAGVDVIDCSSGGVGLRSPTANAAARRPGFQVPFAERIRYDAQIGSASGRERVCQFVEI